MSPIDFLMLMIALTLAAGAWEYLLRYRRRREFHALARDWRMHYVPTDRFALGSRIGPQMSPPGAADLLVRDVIYGRDEKAQRYIFTVEYTTGVIERKKRRRAVAAWLEPRHTDQQATLHLAEAVELAEGYRELAKRFCPA